MKEKIEIFLKGKSNPAEVEEALNSLDLSSAFLDRLRVAHVTSVDQAAKTMKIFVLADQTTKTIPITGIMSQASNETGRVAAPLLSEGGPIWR